MKIIFIFCIMLLTQAGCGDPLPLGKITVKVVDEDGNAVTNATAAVVWSYPKSLTNPWEGYTTKAQDGIVSQDGTFSSSMNGYSDVTLHAHCEGYYRSAKTYEFPGIENNRHIPWNPTVTIRLRKIVNPIAMYAKRFIKLDIPAFETAYDFLKGDFLPPYGQGETADCMISVTSDKEGDPHVEGYWRQQDITLTFPGDFNGIVPVENVDRICESRFQWPRHAYDKNYSLKQIHYRYRQDLIVDPRLNGGSSHPFRKEVITRTPDSMFFFFRIRSEKNTSGTFKSAYYGKLEGPQSAEVVTDSRTGKTCYSIKNLTFYVNPTRNDRNMEYDAEHNNNLSYPRQQSGQGEGYWWIPKYPQGERPVGYP